MLVRIIKRIFGGLFSLLAVGLAGYTGYEVFFSNITFRLNDILFGFTVMLLTCLISSGLLSWSCSSPRAKHLFMTAGIIPVFCFYCFVLVNLLFTNRQYSYEYRSEIGVMEHFEPTANLIPFRTLLSYLTHLDSYNAVTIWRYLAGNLVLLLFMGFFLPLFFKKLRRFLPYTLILLTVVICIELIQLVFTLGVFDVDDILLNMAGGIAGYFIFRIPGITKLQKKMHYIEE